MRITQLEQSVWRHDVLHDVARATNGGEIRVPRTEEVLEEAGFPNRILQRASGSWSFGISITVLAASEGKDKLRLHNKSDRWML